MEPWTVLSLCIVSVCIHWAVDQFVTQLDNETVTFTLVNLRMLVDTLPFVVCANQQWTLFVCASMHAH